MQDEPFITKSWVVNAGDVLDFVLPEEVVNEEEALEAVSS